MVLVAILTILFILTLGICWSLYRRLKLVRKRVQGLMEDLDGLMESGVSERDLFERLETRMTQSRDGFNTFFESGKKSERSSVRLSRNIQKALQYTAVISSDSTVNRRVSDDLFMLVSEGSAAVEEILASVSSLKSQVEIQNSAINSTASSIEEMNSAIKSVSNIASERLTDTSDLVRETGLGSDKIGETDRVIRTIHDSVDDILSFTTVIDEIASKTNLLSMNAAIEAAHAGEAGKGFAVVAEEIRSLAESTAENAASISSTLNVLVSHIESAGESSRQSGEAFVRVESGVKRVAEAFSQINEETNHLTGNAASVVESTVSLRQISEQTTSSMDEMEIGAVEINTTLESSRNIADHLNQSMSRLEEESTGLNLVMTKISESYLNTAHELEHMLIAAEKLESGNRIGSSVFETVRKKLQYTNIILSHINWLSVVRAMIDGKQDLNLVHIQDVNQCSLGKWLNSGDEELIKDSGKKSRLISRHNLLHQILGRIIEKLNMKDEKAVEALYKELMDISGEVVEILMTEGFQDNIVWKPDLSVQVDLFDQHHQKLIEIINQLYKHMESGKGNEILLKTLDDLLVYTDYHFATEEKAFSKYGYPDSEAHIVQHKALLKKAGELSTDLKSGRAVLSNEVLDFLQDWVTNHIMKTDRQYGDFLKGKDMRGLE